MNAAELLAAKDAAAKAIVDRAAELVGIIAAAKQELVDLGIKRVRKPKAEGKKRGRPAGSRNHPKPSPAPAEVEG